MIKLFSPTKELSRPVFTGTHFSCFQISFVSIIFKIQGFGGSTFLGVDIYVLKNSLQSLMFRLSIVCLFRHISFSLKSLTAS